MKVSLLLALVVLALSPAARAEVSKVLNSTKSK